MLERWSWETRRLNGQLHRPAMASNDTNHPLPVAPAPGCLLPGVVGSSVLAALVMLPWLRTLGEGHHGGRMAYPLHLFVVTGAWWLSFGFLTAFGIASALRRKPGRVWTSVVCILVWAFVGFLVTLDLTGRAEREW